MPMPDLLIVGAGAAGLMAAGAACEKGARVALLEHNPKGPGQKILITCPQGVPAQGDDYANVHSVTWMTLSGSLEEGLHIDHIHQLDRGFDFYAPQTFEDEQGRRILIGWMGIPDADYTNPTVDHGCSTRSPCRASSPSLTGSCASSR